MQISTDAVGNNRVLYSFGLVVAFLVTITWTPPANASDVLGPDWDEEVNGGGDAGNKPDTAQKVKLETTTSVTKVSGELKGEEGGSALAGGGSVGDFQDMYEVVIKQPGEFLIQTLPPNGSTEFDSILCVYDHTGLALLANNDADQGVQGSRVGNQSTGGKFLIDQPGAIFISISGVGSLPLNSEGTGIFSFTQNPTDVVGPTAAGQNQPLDAWTGPGPTGSYVIALTAVGPFPPECGAENTQSCGQAHPLPFCNDPVCCVAVCTVDPFCCDVTWDDACVLKAHFLCNSGEGGCGTADTGSCFEPNDTPYCNDPGCCAMVCAQPDFHYCCNKMWDAACVSAALELCSQPCNPDCPPDLNFDEVIDGADLASILGGWGRNGCADIDGNGVVDGADLAIVLGQWGFCTP